MKASAQLKKCIFTAAVIFVAAVTAVVALGTRAFSPYGENSFDREEYRAQLSDIYSEYNTASAYEKYEKGDKFAFSRLLVYGTGGKTYGAEIAAYDAENDFAVLQYDTQNAAKKAYYKIQSDGLIADTEGTAQLCGSKGDLYPAGSSAVGTTQYIGKYAMDSDDVIVSLIDTGVMYNHEALTGRFVNNGYDYSEDGCTDAYFDRNREGDAYGHATFIAGVLADNTPDSVKILPYKVVPFGSTIATASSIINAINDSVSSGATVINISLTSYASGNSFRTAVRNAYNNGVCICAAAGNQSKEIYGFYPAGIEESITVSALESDFQTFADFSNFGSYVDFCATGRSIVSLAPYLKKTDAKTRKNSGTSFSTPYIASLCANLKTVNNSLSVDDICKVLADFSVDFGDEGKDIYHGYGMPVISDITYTDGESYTYKIPEGTLSVYGERDYTADTQPWRSFADRLKSVTVSDSVQRIGDYNFCNMQCAQFDVADSYDRVGAYAFYGCENVKSATFTENCAEIGEKAFGGIDNFVINGYRNTPAETYALSENVTFNVLGCKHNYLVDIIDPTEGVPGYTVYTCSVCGDTYEGPYITPVTVDSGQCGESLSYTYYDTGKLTVSGSGDMYSYTDEPAPWAEYAGDINTIEITGSDCTVSPFAFYGCYAVVKIRCSAANDNYTVLDNVLYSGDMKTLIFLPKISGAAYVMPDTVENIGAPAFIVGAGNAITFNDNFTVDNSIVYDGDGNIVLALPSYKNSTLDIDSDISIADYAFILTAHPDTVNADALSIDFGRCSIGYDFDGILNKRDITFFTYDSGSAKQYAEDNGFALSTYNKGACGENVSWYFDTASLKLTLSGEGEMYSYSSAEDIPWNSYLSTVKEVVIEDGITALSNYAFYNATSLRKLTMPLSVSAPKNNTTWYSCKGINTLILTQGSGYMDDYADDTLTYYQYSPWYISRNALGTLKLSEKALYIGREAFRACSALKSVTLTECEGIATDAFLACTKLTNFTLKSKLCDIADWSVFSYKVSSYGIYSSHIMYAYDDSTAKDYCEKFGAKFVSLGCGHSRDTTLISEEIHTCCFDSVYCYHCADCDSNFTEYVPTTDGHYVSGTLTNTSGDAVSGAEVCIDGALCAVTAADGSFIAESVKCGTHSLTFRKQSSVFFTAELVIDKSNTTGDFAVTYGDYNSDGIINGRDLAFAKIHDIDDSSLFDWGSSVTVRTISSQYGEQQLPHAVVHGFSPAQGSDYQQLFSIRMVNNSNYSVTSSGFLYGKELGENDLVLEKADTVAENGNRIRIAESADPKADNKVLTYGLKSKTSWFAVRFFIVYTNGVNNHIYYSDVYTYSYD